MYIHELLAMTMARDRMQNAARAADQASAIERARELGLSRRARLGAALTRLGRRIQGQPSSLAAESP
jgi:hypothetical protein